MNKNILINALSARNGGGVTYIRNILPFFDKFKGTNNISILTLKKNNELEDIENISGINVLKVNIDPDSVLQRIKFELFEIPKIMKKESYDILFSPGGTSITLRSDAYETVTMFRNVWPHYYFQSMKKSFFKEPKNFIKLFLLKLLIIFNCKMSDKTIYISNHGKKLINNTSEARNKNIVIKHAINEIYYQRNKLNSVYSFKPLEYILYVSSFQPYKNHENLLQAYSNTFDSFKSIPLVLIGKISEEYEIELKKLSAILNIDNNVIILKEVNAHTLSGLYQNSFFNLFLSSCENCPNTMLEAMASLRPLLSSSNDPMPEFGRDKVTYCDPLNINDISKKLLFMKKYMNELELKAIDAKKSIENKRGWEKTAHTTYKFLIS